MCGSTGNGQNAAAARIEVSALALDQDGNLFIAEYTYNRIRKVDPITHTISVIAGNGLPERVEEIL